MRFDIPHSTFLFLMDFDEKQSQRMDVNHTFKKNYFIKKRTVHHIHSFRTKNKITI